MKIHEYQAAALFAQYGIPVSEGMPAFTPEEAEQTARSLGEGPYVIKAQIHSGGRGKAGGVKMAQTPADGACPRIAGHAADNKTDRPAGQDCPASAGSACNAH